MIHQTIIISCNHCIHAGLLLYFMKYMHIKCTLIDKLYIQQNNEQNTWFTYNKTNINKSTNLTKFFKHINFFSEIITTFNLGLLCNYTDCNRKAINAYSCLFSFHCSPHRKTFSAIFSQFNKAVVVLIGSQYCINFSVHTETQT